MDYNFNKVNSKMKRLANSLLDTICYLTYQGNFRGALKLIKEYEKLYKITSTDASRILSNTGLDIKYSFVKELVNRGGKFPSHVNKFADEMFAEFIKKKASNDIIKGWKLVLSKRKK